MSEKKTVKRSTAIALGIVCILLVVGSGAAIVYYSMRTNDLVQSRDERASYAKQLEIWLDQAKLERDQIKQQRDQLLNQYNDLVAIAQLQKQRTVLSQYTINQGANARSLVTSLTAEYAGYVIISMTSTTTNAYIILEYWYNSVLFSFQKTIGTSGTAYFCVLPASIAIYIGNSNFSTGATHTLTITYYY